MAIPKTAAGLFTFIILTGWLISLVPIFGGTQAPLDQITSIATNAQTNIGNAGNCLSTGANTTTNNATNQISLCAGSHWYDAIWEVLTIFFNIFVIIFSFLAGIFLASATFITVMLGLPTILSQLIITIISVATIFSIIKVLIPDH